MEKINKNLFYQDYKLCKRCNQIKLKYYFNVDNSRKDKCKHSCKECMKNYRSQGNYKNLERLRTIKNKDRNSFLVKERHKKYKQQYIIKKNELKEELINNGYKEIPILKNHFINKYGVICTFSELSNFIRYKICPAKMIYGIINIYGYRVFKKGKKEYRIHQLVAVTFLNHKINGHKSVIDHVDSNKLNNHVSNLQIVTQFQNLIKGRYHKSKDPKWIKWIESIRY